MWRGAGELACGGLMLVALGCGTPERALPTGGAPRRIVSLAPSVTETLFALGVGERLVGVCGQCNHPPEVAHVARVGGYLTPSVEAVLAVEPDLVVAVPSPGNREAVAAVERAGLRVLVVEDRTLADLWASITVLGEEVGAPGRAAELVERLKGELARLRAQVPTGPRPRVLLVVGHRPLVVAGPGTLQAELLELVGGENVAADAPTAWPQLSLEVVMTRRPDVVFDAAMGGEIGDGIGVSLFAGRVVPVAADVLFRAGPRVVDAARLLADALAAAHVAAGSGA